MEILVKTVLTLSLSVVVSFFSASFIVFGLSEKTAIKLSWIYLIVTVSLLWIIYLISIFSNKTASRLFFSQIKLLVFLISLFLVLGLIIKPIYYSYHTYSGSKNVYVLNLKDRPLELVQGLPIGIEFEYSLLLKPYFFSSTHRTLGGRKYYIYDYVPDSYYYNNYLKSFGPEGIFPEPLSITTLGGDIFNGSEFQVGQQYNITWRSYPVFITRNSSPFRSEICVRNPHPSERVNELNYVSIVIGPYQATTSNKYNLNEFYNNAVASGIPSCY
jgi:hypothetical protein